MFSSGKKIPTGTGKGRASLSVIGEEVIITGDIATAAKLHIDGRVEGNVRCDLLIEGPGGTIIGDIIAGEARLAGLVDGKVEARTLILEPTAQVTGDVCYESLSIASGARIDGRFSPRREVPAGDALAKPSAVAGAEMPARINGAGSVEPVGLFVAVPARIAAG